MRRTLTYFIVPFSSGVAQLTTFLFSVILILQLPLFSIAQEKTSIRKVVIDAGHGGKDPGTIGRKTQEKDVVLSIALYLGKKIRENCPDVKVIFTRETDTFVELYQRAAIANRNKADLFISIHCNANKVHTFQGSETYVMGLHKTQQNLEISKLENASILMEPDYLINYDGFDPNSDESYITFTLFQNAYLNQSLEFASLVQQELKSGVGLGDRGVRQAGFLVLYKTTMPSVLVETGFLSNPQEESFLLSRLGQEHVADAIYTAFMHYKGNLEKTSRNEIKFEPNVTVKEDTQKSVTNPQSKKMVEKTLAKSEGESVAKGNISIEQPTNPPAPIEKKLVFHVQVAAYPTEIGVKNKKFSGLQNVTYYKQNNLFKYIVGNEETLESANKLLNQVIKCGYHDAFVVAFFGDERITIKEAKEILLNQNVK